MPTFADILPANARRVIYIVLGIAVPLEGIWDVLPDVWEGKVLATIAALGFGLAALNTPRHTRVTPEAQVSDSTP